MTLRPRQRQCQHGRGDRTGVIFISYGYDRFSENRGLPSCSIVRWPGYIEDPVVGIVYVSSTQRNDHVGQPCEPQSFGSVFYDITGSLLVDIAYCLDNIRNRKRLGSLSAGWIKMPLGDCGALCCDWPDVTSPSYTTHINHNPINTTPRHSNATAEWLVTFLLWYHWPAARMRQTSHSSTMSLFTASSS